MGESDKMNSNSVANRECRAVPTPKVVLLYDEHRDAVADAFARYSRQYARFTFAVARLQQIFMLATRWKDPCILAYPWMKDIFRVAAQPFSQEDIRKGMESDPFEVGQVTYRLLHVCVGMSEWLAATERVRLDYHAIFREEFSIAKSIVEDVVAALPKDWIKDDQYMKDGFWRFFFDLDESTGRYSFRDEFPAALLDCCMACPYDKTVNLHLAADDGRFHSALVAIEGMHQCIRECTAHLRGGKANGHVWLSPMHLSAILHPFSFQFLDLTKPPPGIQTPLTFCHDMFGMIQGGIADWADFIDALSEALPGSSVFMGLTSSFNSLISLYSGVFAFSDMSIPKGQEKTDYLHELNRFAGLLERAGQELFEREAQAASNGKASNGVGRRKPSGKRGVGGRGPKTEFMKKQLCAFVRYLSGHGYDGDESALYAYANRCWLAHRRKWDAAKSAEGQNKGYSAPKVLADAYKKSK